MSILNFSAITFSFSAAVILSSCGSRRTDLLPSGLMLLCELEIPSTSGGHYSGYTAGEGILNKDTVIQTLSCLNTASDLFEIEDG